MSWVIYVIIAITGLTSYNVTAKIAGGKIEPLLSTTFSTLFSGLLLALVTLFYYWRNGQSVGEELTSAGANGLYASALIGVTMMMINGGYIFAYTKGGPIGIVGPVVSGASIGLVVVISALFFGEGMSLNKILGATFLGLGTLFIMKG